jgi:hypothetical protein
MVQEQLAGCSKIPSSAAEANYRLSRGGWDDPNCARPTRAFSCRALREQGDRPSYPAPFFSILLERNEFHSRADERLSAVEPECLSRAEAVTLL